MSINQLSTLSSLTCSLHPDEPLNLFCDAQDCPSKGLICCLCEAQSHKHAVLPFKVLIKNIQKDLSGSGTDNSLVLMAAQCDFEFHRCINLLDSMKNKQDAENLKDSIHHYFRKVGKMVLKPKALEILPIIEGKENNIDIAQLNQFLGSYNKLYKETKSTATASNHITHLKQLVDDLSVKYADLEKSISSDTKLEIMFQIYDFAVGNANITYFFSPTFKNSSHILNGTTQVTQQNNYNTNFCLIEPSIEGTTKYNPSPKTIKLKIVKLTSWISIGLVHANIAKTANYYFNTATTGHGAYMVSNDGYSWHHHTSTLNSFYNSFSFEQGDILVMLANPKSKIIKFWKEKAPDHVYEMAFEISTTDKLHFAVSLSSHQESVEIINAN